MNDSNLSILYEISQRWTARTRPDDVPDNIPVKCLPKSKYDGDNPYNGFSGAQRRKEEQVLQVLRRRGYISPPLECDICGATNRIGFHAEDYFDPFSLARVCFPCHMAIHRRFKSPDKWHTLLDRNSNSVLIEDFRQLPMQEVDFATWLMKNTSGPYDVIKRVWPTQIVPDYQPRVRKMSVEAIRYKVAIEDAQPTETEWKLMRTLWENPGANSETLTACMNWKGQTWHLKFGQFCHRLESSLGDAPLADARKDNKGHLAKFYIGLLASFDDKTRGFQFLPEAQSALDAFFKS
jgi:hypothetical protein